MHQHIVYCSECWSDSAPPNCLALRRSVYAPSISLQWAAWQLICCWCSAGRNSREKESVNAGLKFRWSVCSVTQPSVRVILTHETLWWLTWGREQSLICLVCLLTAVKSLWTLVEDVVKQADGWTRRPIYKTCYYYFKCHFLLFRSVLKPDNIVPVQFQFLTDIFHCLFSILVSVLVQ